MSNEAASSPAVRSPCPRSRRISRRVGSDNALKTWFSAIMPVHSHGRGDYLDRCLILSRPAIRVNAPRRAGRSRLLELDPARARGGRDVGEEVADEGLGPVRDEEGPEVVRADEAPGDPVVEQRDQRIEV